MSLPASASFEVASAVIKNKKSRIIPPERRKKVAKACDNCKRRKQRCNGGLPCSLCAQKSFECTYTGIDKRNLKPSRKLSDSDQLPGPKRSQNHQIPSGSTKKESSSYVIPPSLQPLFQFPIDVQLIEDAEGDNTENSSDITLRPEEEGLNSRLLYDQTGNLRYIGESSPGSFLPQCRKVFVKILGVSRFTHDPERFRIIDSLSTKGVKGPLNLPGREYADHLAHLFKENINDLIYVFNKDYFENEIMNKTFENPSGAKPQHLCLLYLVMGIGLLYSKIEMQRQISKFSQEHFIHPQLFYQNALNLVHEHQNDCNLWLVEAHLLMFFFDELNMTRNSSWINLGISIRYAQALGMHRRYVNEAYKEPGYALHRRKLFRSLYIADRTSSTFLGRSLTISDLEWDDKDSLNDLNDLQGEYLKVSNINGKILSKVYYNPSIGIKNALKLAVEMKNYSVNSSIGKSLDFRKRSNYDNNLGLLLVHIYHLNGFILLSRPFFFFVILIKLNFIKFDEKSKNASYLKNFYQSCIKASTLLIKLIEYHFVNNIHPLKVYTITSSTLHAGLMLGMVLLLQSQDIDDEFYGEDQDTANAESSKVVCVSAMNSAIKILNHYGDLDPTPKRYAQILANMLDATKVQRHSTVQESAKRQQQQMQSNATQYQNRTQPAAVRNDTTYSHTPPPLVYQQFYQRPQSHQQQYQPQPSQAPPQAQPQYPYQQSIPQQQDLHLNYQVQNQDVDVNLKNLITPADNSFYPNTNPKFEDWLFPKIDSIHEGSVRSSRRLPNHKGISPASTTSSEWYQSDDLLKDFAGLNNISSSGIGNQFLNDLLFNVVDNSHSDNPTQ